MVLVKALPQTCSSERMAYEPAAFMVRALANAAQDVASAVWPLPSADVTIMTQCRRLHVFLYVRSKPALPSVQSLLLFSLPRIFCCGRDRLLALQTRLQALRGRDRLLALQTRLHANA